MGWLEDLGNQMGLGDLDRGDNEFRDVNRESFDLPGFDERDRYLNQTSRDFLNRVAPQAADSDFRRYQGETLDRLGRLARGDDSITAMQLQRGQDQLARQQLAMAAGAAPGAGAAARRWAMQNMARGNQGLAFDQAQAGLMERNAANNLLGQLATGARGQDIQRNEFNVGAQQTQTGMNQQGWLGAQDLALQNARGQQQGGFQYEQQRGNRFHDVMQQPTTGERALGAITGAAELGIQAFAPTAAPAMAQVPQSAGYTPEEFNKPLTLQTGPDAMPYVPTAQGTGYTPGAYNVPMRLAEGGIVTKPTKAIVGEAGPEAVIPLPYLPELVKRLEMAKGLQAFDRSLQDRGMVGIVDKEHPGRINQKPYERTEMVFAPEPVEPSPRSSLSVVEHMRDPVAERPFIMDARADQLQRQADYQRQLAKLNRGY